MNMLCSSKDLFTRMRRKATEWKRGLLALYIYISTKDLPRRYKELHKEKASNPIEK